MNRPKRSHSLSIKDTKVRMSLSSFFLFLTVFKLCISVDLMTDYFGSNITIFPLFAHVKK